jgi:MarR family transcriptional regulator, lower aerobic nicotinate degradation pathway regulator
MASQPVASPPVHRSGALLDHLARRMRLRAESVLAPLGLRPRHLVALTVLRGRDGITQQALSSTLEMDGTNIVGLLNELAAVDNEVLAALDDSQREVLYNLLLQAARGSDVSCPFD